MSKRRRSDPAGRVLRKLTIEDGVAIADFSGEMKAYGGGSTRVTLIREQIARTLKQFPSIKEVRVAVEGRTEGVLEPECADDAIVRIGYIPA
ncbi:MAG: GerMN domain-containing protein [Chloroflexota bacterium]